MKDVTAEWRFSGTTTASEVKGAYTGSVNTAQLVTTCSSGNVSATVTLYGSHVAAPDAWDTIATFVAAGTSSAPGSDGATFTCAYPYMKAECSAISGTNAVAKLRVQRA